MGKKIAIVDSVLSSYEEERGVLAEIGEVVFTSGDTPDEILKMAHDADGILVNLNAITKELMGQMPRCKIISRYGVGYDNVDVAAATAAGIWVANVTDYATEDVSDHTLALLLACVRKITYRNSGIRQGRWNLQETQQSRRVKGKVLGLIGFGNIGSAVCRKTKTLGLEKVLVHDPFIDQSIITNAGVEASSLDDMLSRADFVSLHLPLNDSTHHMVDKAFLNAMKSGAFLINTSRGGVVDTAAIVSALKNGDIAYAALDVHEQEPLPKDSPLFSLENVILTDHCGWYTEESIIELKTRAAENVAVVLQGGKPHSPVNSVPEAGK